jgi:hypothetical protein
MTYSFLQKSSRAIYPEHPGARVASLTSRFASSARFVIGRRRNDPNNWDYLRGNPWLDQGEAFGVFAHFQFTLDVSVLRLWLRL